MNTKSASTVRKGTLAGALAGFVAAAANWDGNIVVALSSIMIGAAIGWVVGYYLGKRSSL